MSNEKIYLGSGKKAKDFDIVNITVCLSKIPKESIYEYNGEKYVNLSVSAKKEVDQYGKSHSVALNTFEKKDNNQSDNLPF